MEIVHEPGNKPLHLFNGGEVFRIDSDYYMVLISAANNIKEKGIVIAANLDYGGIIRFKEDLAVSPVRCELLIKNDGED